MRLAVFPRLDRDSWDVHRCALLDNLDNNLVFALQDKNLLESYDYPNFGHETRHVSARHYLLEKYLPQVKYETEALMFRLASEFQRKLSFEPTQPSMAALASFRDFAREFQLSDAARSLGEIAKSFYKEDDFDAGLILRAGSLAIRKVGAVRDLVLMGTLNSIARTIKEHKLEACLQELRKRQQLSEGRHMLAYVLMVALETKEQNKFDNRDVLLEELRELQQAWPDDDDIRRILAERLLKMLDAAKAENDLEQRDALFDELHGLQQGWLDNEGLRDALACSLFSALREAKEENNLHRRDKLLKELRKLEQAWPNDSNVREQLARGLGYTVKSAAAENNPELRDALLEELRTLQQAWPNDSNLATNLAIALVMTFRAKEDNHLDRVNAILEELEKLHQAHPHDGNVRECLALTVKKILELLPKENNNLERRNALLDRLRKLQQAWPDDATRA